MIRNALLFFAGCLTAVVVALYLGQPNVEPPESASTTSQSDSPAQARSVVRNRAERVPDDSVTATDSVGLESTSRPITEPADELAQAVEARIGQFAESLQSTPEEVLSLMEGNLNALASDPDRQDRFANQAETNSARLPQVENLVTNELWRNAYATPPINVESVCYPAGCRLKLFFADTEELIAVAGGSLHVRMLLTLREYGFAASEIEVDFGEGADPNAPAEAVDVFLWPKSDSRLQSATSLLRG
jgi:hypothetical protein